MLTGGQNGPFAEEELAPLAKKEPERFKYSRDGAWLLRVERQTYDLVLDRFPWGWEWLRLPWMDAPLRVEW